MADLKRIVESMQDAACTAGVPIVTGDTKVVDRGKGDGVFITTSGVGIIPQGVHSAPDRAQPGDVILVNGPIADHGIAILSVREGLDCETEVRSDSAALHQLVSVILSVGGDGVHVLRDPTRGGVASATNEIATSSRVGMVLEEAALPLREEVRGACAILGFDPLYVANEGKCLVFVAKEQASAVVRAMRMHPLGAETVAIGEVVEAHPGRVILESRIGGRRVVDMLSGEQLPRIC
jgi:hydrogenase expression/formation protein HypE